MPTVFTHAAVGLGLAALAPARWRGARFWTLSAALPVVPDLDVVAFAVGVPYDSMWSHRGLSHSLLAAGLAGVVAGIALARHVRTPVGALAVYFTAVTASHGVLDAFTNGGLGVAFLAPVDPTRYFFPWRPIEVSPLGMAFFSAWGLRALVSELLWVWLPTAVAVGAARLLRPGREARRA